MADSYHDAAEDRVFASRPTLVGPIPKFPKVRCDACGQIYVSTVVVAVPTTKPCPTCGAGSFSSSFTVEAT